MAPHPFVCATSCMEQCWPGKLCALAEQGSRAESILNLLEVLRYPRVALRVLERLPGIGDHGGGGRRSYGPR